MYPPTVEYLCELARQSGFEDEKLVREKVTSLVSREAGDRALLVERWHVPDARQPQPKVGQPRLDEHWRALWAMSRNLPLTARLPNPRINNVTRPYVRQHSNSKGFTSPVWRLIPAHPRGVFGSAS